MEIEEAAPARARTPLFRLLDRSETKQRVAKYFETSGFSRWTAIYGQGSIPPIWRVIRDGHDLVLDQVMEWIAADPSAAALDAGCGTGTLTMRLIERGYRVDGIDVSAPMISFARYNTQDRSVGITPRFFVGDIAALNAEPRSYDLVCCLDVLFHYPYAEVKAMLENLAELSSYKVIGSFAIRTNMNSLWMEIGKRFFHKKNRMTSLHLHSYDQVEQILYRAGFKLTRAKRVKKFFYDSYVFEAIRR